MDVVYLYFEAAETRIPFYKKRHIVSLLTDRGGGVLDEARQEIIFPRKIDAQQLGDFLPCMPIVQVDENSVNEPVVSNFFERPWSTCSMEDYPVNHAEPPSSTPPPSSCFTFPIVPSGPEKFSEYWHNQLDDELRSRKYSPQTRRLYLYYNRLLCRTINKSPEEIHQSDVTLFLALVEKDREYSASSINLAISAIKFFYSEVLKSGIVTEQHRPRESGHLPQVLSKEEIGKLLVSEKNPKHRFLLMLV